MPYSISALFALPRSFAGLFFASKVVHVSTPSPPVVKYTPTRTTHIFLEPTRCLPSPTSSDVQLPYVVMVGLALVIIASVVFTVCSTFALRCRRRSPTLPAAPPGPDTETEPDEFDAWPPWLMFISLNIAFYLFSTVTVIQAPPTKSLFPELMLYRLAMVLEETVLNVLSIVQHIHDHGLQYLNIMLLALIGHTIGLLIFFIHRRSIMPSVRRHCLPLTVVFVAACTLSIPFIIILWHPNLNWSPLLLYYSMTRTQHLQGLLPNIQRICFNIWLFLRSQTSAYVPMIMGPAAIYSATSLFQLALFFLFQVAPTMRILRKVFLYRHRRALSVIICLLIWDAFSAFILYSSARATFMTVELPNLDNISRSRILELEPQALWSAEAGAQIWELYQPSLELYRYWRMGQTRELRRLTRFPLDHDSGVIPLPANAYSRAHRCLVRFLLYQTCREENRNEDTVLALAKSKREGEIQSHIKARLRIG